MNKAAIIGLLALSALTTAADQPKLKQLYDQHRWFDLRDAIETRSAPPLYKGAVASAFDRDRQAEQYLNRLILLKPHSDNARTAHEILAKVYARGGRYREALHQLDEMQKISSTPDVENMRAIFAAWAGHPDQSVASPKTGTIRAQVLKDGIKLPVEIHGKTVHWLLDTGFNFSFMSESEAQRLGVQTDKSSGAISDAAGGTAAMHTAVVDDIALGDVHLHNVAFLIQPDSQEPMSDWPPGERGVIGLPVVIALRSISWSSDGNFEMNSASETSGHVTPNLCFDGLNMVGRVELDGKELEFGFDTGDQSGTQLWHRFANDFPTLLKAHGVKSSRRVTMVGGSNERETIMLPELLLRVGGLNAVLHHAQVYSGPVGDDFHHGLLGMDVLSQARKVRIDFQAMRYELSQ